ncbi:hypothetical protein EV361DRAFT_478698 [Lentinula raphanica]|uniref:Uncharacterized protein n=1 Tax=Lentinula raphanica TaxID=153919 RepID=A0AA38P0L4_9AGAR|nr:hypothetical protein F5878DRAFT_374316 [Lentinula raphanica]KAJ3967657.1 hypothetical protein EV361DRAFT_478698 [Lentinula raphanica]
MPRLALSLVPLKAWVTKATWAEFLPSLKTLTKLFTYQLFEEQELSGRSLPSIMLRAVQQACDRASLVSLTMFEDLTAVVMKKFSKDLSTAAFSDIVYGAERRWPVLALKGWESCSCLYSGYCKNFQPDLPTTEPTYIRLIFSSSRGRAGRRPDPVSHHPL